MPPWLPTPSLNRPMFRMPKAILWPLPISPSRRSLGMRQFSRITVRVELPLMPSFFSSAPVLMPGSVFSTMKALNCWPSTLAKITKTSAKPALVIHILVPFSTQWSPSSTAVALAPMASEPLPASVRA